MPTKALDELNRLLLYSASLVHSPVWDCRVIK